MTKVQAIINHRAMWNWIADNISTCFKQCLTATVRHITITE